MVAFKNLSESNLITFPFPGSNAYGISSTEFARSIWMSSRNKLQMKYLK